MNKCYFEKGCYESPIWSCNCVNPSVYICDHHIKRHMKSLGKHVTECIVVELTSRQTTELLPRLKDLLKYFKGYRKSIKDNSKTLIECIEKEATKALMNVKNLQKAVVDLICEKSIFKETFERIKSIKIENQNHIRNDAENIQESMKILFEFEGISWKECNEIIFSRGSSQEGLLSFDLNTYTLSRLKYAPYIGKYSQACKIDQNTYFFHGGIKDGNARDKAYLINIKETNYASLTEGPVKRYGGAPALKDNKVYIFGDNDEDNIPTNTCDIFDLKRKEWISITPLPRNSDDITAAILNSDIIISGYNFRCCYSYNDSTYTKILDLPTGPKVVCKGWIFTNLILYENQSQNNSEWFSHHINYPWDNYLWTYCVFKRNQYLYFIDSSDALMRIDTKLKIIEAFDIPNEILS